MASRARNKLSARQVETITTPGIYSDGGGLYLRIRGSGKAWVFIGSQDGKRFELGLGSAIDVSLAKAREMMMKIRLQMIDGIDPMTERKKAKVERARLKAVEKAAKQGKPAVLTFGAFTKQFVASIEDGFKNPKHRQQWRNTLDTYAKPLYDLPIEAVMTADVLAVIEPIWLSKPETASRVRGRIERVLDAAKAKNLREGENPARLKGNLDVLLPTRSKVSVKHHSALPYAEVAAFLDDLKGRPGVAARALEFVVLTAARSGEVRGMTWGEVDLENKIWTVPAARMKAGEEHSVPLSEAAIAVLHSAKEDGLEPGDFVFPAPRGGSLSDMTLSAVLKRMDRKDITVHGFRSAFRDWAGDKTDFEREVVEMALAHTITSAVERAYRRGRALEKRRELMNAWAYYCAGKPLQTEAPEPPDAVATTPEALPKRPKLETGLESLPLAKKRKGRRLSVVGL